MFGFDATIIINYIFIVLFYMLCCSQLFCNFYFLTIGSTPWQLGASGLDELTAEDSASNADREADDDNEFPALSLPPGLTERQGYKVIA